MLSKYSAVSAVRHQHRIVETRLCFKKKHVSALQGRFSIVKPVAPNSQSVVGRATQGSSEWLLGVGCRLDKRSIDYLSRGVYVLRGKKGNIYVGKSSNIHERLSQHARGEGAACIDFPFERVSPLTPVIEDLESWERAEVLTRMYLTCISKVRGWMYTSRTLTVEQRQHAYHQICEKFDLCRCCGRKGHFIKQCPSQASAGTQTFKPLAFAPSWAL